MNILVTGGAGYIGSHFCKAAHKAGHRPFVIDDLSTGHREFVKWGEFLNCSVAETESIHQLCKKQNIEAVVHFAAKSLVGESVAHPELYQKNNVEGTRSLVAAVTGTPVQYFIFSSSAATYGQPEVDLISENTPQRPVNPYGESKLECEKLLLKQHGFKLGILRYFNVTGCDAEGEIFERHEPETHLVPNILKAMQSKQSFGLYGQDYPTPDGTCVRDYVDVNDLALVHLAALNFLSQNPGPLISNVGRGQGYSIQEVLDAIKKVTGSLPSVVVKERRPGDPPRLVASAEHFKSWCPIQLRTLEESVRNLARHI